METLHQIPQSNALVIRIIIVDREVRRVYVDNRAAISVMFMDCFRKLRSDKEQLHPCGSLQTFAQGIVQLEGSVTSGDGGELPQAGHLDGDVLCS